MSMTSLATATSAPLPPTLWPPSSGQQPNPGKSVAGLSTTASRTEPFAVADTTMTVPFDDAGTAFIRNLITDPSLKSERDTVVARRAFLASSPVKFTVGTKRDERPCVQRRRLQQKRRQTQSFHHEPAKAAVVLDQDSTPPVSPRREKRVRWADDSRIVSVERTASERLAQRSYGIALQFAKLLRKKSVPDPFIDAVFELEEQDFEAFDAALQDGTLRSQVRNQVKIIMQRRQSVYKIAANKEFLKILATMGRAILRLAEDVERHDPDLYATCTVEAAIKTPPPPSPPQGTNIVSPTRIRVFFPSWFTKDSLDFSASSVENCMVATTTTTTSGRCHATEVDAMAMAIFEFSSS